MKIIRRFKILIVIIAIFIISWFLPIIPSMSKQSYDVYGCKHLIFRTLKDLLISNTASHNVIEFNTIKKNNNCYETDPSPYNFKESFNENLPQDQLSPEQLKLIEAAGTDTKSTYFDARFPDGTLMWKWDCVNDKDYIKKNSPEVYKKCLEFGY